MLLSLITFSKDTYSSFYWLELIILETIYQNIICTDFYAFSLLSNVCYNGRNGFVLKLLSRQEADKNRISLKLCVYISYN